MLDSMEINAAAVAPYETRPEFDEAVDRAATAASAYYDTDTVTMVDADYDTLVDRIAATRDLHPDWDDHGVVTEVAAGQSSGGDVTHPTPMLSLAKVTDTNPDHNAITSPDEFDRFLRACARGGYSVEVKLDGNAIRAVYENGQLVLAATRGDGRTGENVTPNVLRAPGITGLPATLPTPWSGEVRGEIFMTDTDFETASNNRVEAGGKPFANPRNATSGSLRALDRTYDAPMSFGAYAITGDDIDSLPSHSARMDKATSLGFITAASLTPGDPWCDSVANAKFQIVNIKVERDTLGFPIDGAVISYNTDADRDKVGEGNRVPKWAMAWKYPAQEVTTTLLGIEVAVGKTGRLSLTGVLEPVYVDGSVVSRVSMHNPEWVHKAGFGLGARVMLVKRGDIIPYISMLDAQPADVVPWTTPETCPKCEQPWDKSSLLWRCLSAECSVAGRLTYFLSSDALDVDGFGPSIAEALAESNTVSDSLHAVADLFFLTEDQWATLPMGETKAGAQRLLGVKNARTIMEGLEKAKQQPLNRVITSLSLRHGGRSVGRWLASEFHTMDRLRAATVADIAAIERMGEVKARAIVDGLARMSDVLDRLALAGLNMGEEPSDDGSPKPFAGQTYVVSGAVPGYTRTTIAEAIEARGGRASSSVSKTTTALVTAETDTSKAKKAASLGIPVIDPDEFVRMLNGA